jgi:hypothetical protein
VIVRIRAQIDTIWEKKKRRNMELVHIYLLPRDLVHCWQWRSRVEVYDFGGSSTFMITRPIA